MSGLSTGTRVWYTWQFVYTHDRIRARFCDGGKIDDLADQIVQGPHKIEDVWAIYGHKSSAPCITCGRSARLPLAPRKGLVADAPTVPTVGIKKSTTCTKLSSTIGILPVGGWVAHCPPPPL